MNGSLSQTSELISGIAGYLNGLSQNSLSFDVLVCPPSPYLAAANAAVDSNVAIGAQNVNANSNGAFTGEIALSMLSEFFCDYVLLGHSERRELFAETDEHIAAKFAACIGSEITPILCIGETLQHRQAGVTESVISKQLDAVLEVVGIAGFSKAVIAYEPVWAIGTGETATPDQAQEVHAFIRSKLESLDKEVASDMRILYGGSMKAENAHELLSQPDIDGGLIGGAALKVDSFTGICQVAHGISK